MILDVSPRRLEAHSGFTQYVQVTISNPGEVIGGYQVRVLGADPSWVKLDDATISLFPQESTTVTIELTLPEGLPAGERQLSVQVRELTPPEDVAVESVVIEVPEAPNVHLRVDPIVQQAGRKVRYAMLLDNAGNTVVEGRFAGTDPEDEARFTFTPPTVRLLPGEHAVIDVLAKARQPLLGSPIIRALNFYLDDPETQAALAEQAKQAGKQLDPALDETPEADKLEFRVPGRKRQAKDLPKPERPTDPLATATFIQKARIGRAAVSLGGLLAAVSVFALVITFSLSQIVKQSAADRDLALAIVSAQNSDGGATGSSSLGGTVRLLTSSSPVAGVAVTLYKADDLKNPLATTATGADGTYTFANLPASDYKINYKGAGFIQLWYPGAVDESDATAVTLDANNRKGGLDVNVGGVPATLEGKVTGDDVSGATLTLLIPVTSVNTGATSEDLILSGTSGQTQRVTRLTSAAVGRATTDSELSSSPGAVVKTVAIGGDGTFQISDVPSPSIYQVQVSKPGYATSTQLINVSAGENRQGLTIALRKGDGVVSGVVTTASGPLGGVTVTATSGTTSVTTVSSDDSSGDGVGSFTLRGLPTPSQVTITARLSSTASGSASSDVYAPQTVTVTLAAGQALTGLSLTLGAASATIGGTVTLNNGVPAEGVIVTIQGGQTNRATATSSTGVWQLAGVSIPGTYTVLFDRDGVDSYTTIVNLDRNGTLTNPSVGVTTALSISPTLHPTTGTLYGTVTLNDALQAGTTVTATCGSTTYSVTTANSPLGAYRIEGVTPGYCTLSSSVGGVSTGVSVLAGDYTQWNVDYRNDGVIDFTVCTTGVCPPTATATYDVMLFDLDNSTSISTQSAVNSGLFLGLATGNYQIRVYSSGTSTLLQTQNVTIGSDNHPSVTIQVP